MPDADKEDALIVAVMRDGKVYFGNDQIPPDQLTNKVKDRMANRVNKTVYVRADARAKYKERGRGGGQRPVRGRGRSWLADRSEKTDHDARLRRARLRRAPAGLNKIRGSSYGNVNGWWKGWARALTSTSRR